MPYSDRIKTELTVVRGENAEITKQENNGYSDQSAFRYDELSGPTHRSISVGDLEKTLQKAKSIKGKQTKRQAKVSFYDFAGQDIFHASHPTFLSPKAIYILVFNLQYLHQWQEKDVGNTATKQNRQSCTEAKDLSDQGKRLFSIVLDVIVKMKKRLYIR